MVNILNVAKFLDIGGGNPSDYSEYSHGFVQTPDLEDGWISLNPHKEANPTFVGSVENMYMFPDNKFDYIRLLHFPSTSLSYDALGEISRVLKPNRAVYIRTGRTILENESFARDFMGIFHSTLISGVTEYHGLKRP